MKITSKPLALVIVVVIFGGIVLTSAMNWWKDGASKIPRTLTQGEEAGQYNPADIRGSYTFGDVSKYFNIPFDTLRTVFHVPADKDIAAMALKDMGLEDLNVSPHSVAFFAALYNGLPFTVEGEELFLPVEAVTFLKQQGKMTPEQLAYVEAHTVTIPAASAAPVEKTPQAEAAATVAATPVPTKSEGTSASKTVSSTTTFQNLLDWGLTKEAIEKVIGGAIPDPNMAVKDYISGKGLEFKTYKDQLQEALNNVK